MTGNTWDIIKIQTKTNQLMMGNRKDHIRVRGQRQRKTKSDTLAIFAYCSLYCTAYLVKITLNYFLVITFVM